MKRKGPSGIDWLERKSNCQRGNATATRPEPIAKISMYVARIDRPPSIICTNECANTDVRKVNVSCLAVDVEGLSLRLPSIHPVDWGIIAMMFAVYYAVLATF